MICKILPCHYTLYHLSQSLLTGYENGARWPQNIIWFEKSLNFTLEEPFEEGCSDEPWLEPELMWLETLPVLWSE